MLRIVFFSSHKGRRGASKSSGGAELLALAEFSGELDHDNYGNFLLSLRCAEFAGEECRVLGLTCFDKTATDCLSAMPVGLTFIRGGFTRSLLAGQSYLNSGPNFRHTLLMILNDRRQHPVSAHSVCRGGNVLGMIPPC